MDASIKKVFDNTCAEITNKLRERLKMEYDKIAKQLITASGVSKLDKKIELLNNKITEIENEIERLNMERDEILPNVRLSNEQQQELKKICGQLSISTHYYMKQYVVDAIRKVSETREYQNFVNRQSIEQGFRYTSNLTISKKEQRNILLQLQNYDWQSLGIDMPPQFINIANIQIRDGVISMNSLPKPKK